MDAFHQRFQALEADGPLHSCRGLRTFLPRAMVFLAERPECARLVAHFLMGKADYLPRELSAPRPAMHDDVKLVLHDLLRTHRYGCFCKEEPQEKTLEKLRMLNDSFGEKVLRLNDRKVESGATLSQSPLLWHDSSNLCHVGPHMLVDARHEVLREVEKDVKLDEMSISDGLDALQRLKEEQRCLDKVRPLSSSSFEFGLGLDQPADFRLPLAKGLVLLSRFTERTDWHDRLDDSHWKDELKEAVRCVFPESEYGARAVVEKIVDFLRQFQLACTSGLFSPVPRDQIPAFIIDPASLRYLAACSEHLANGGVLLSLLYDNLRQEEGLPLRVTFGRPESYAVQMLAAYEYVLRDAPPLEDFCFESIEKIHAVCTGGAGKRFTTNGYGLVDPTPEGWQALLDIQHEYVSRPGLDGTCFKIWKNPTGLSGVAFRVELVGHREQRKKMLWEKVEAYKSTWRTMDAKSRLRGALAIGKLADILHLFSDGNSRTGSLVAQYLNAHTGGRLYQIDALSHLESRSVEDLLGQALAWQTSHLPDDSGAHRIAA